MQFEYNKRLSSMIDACASNQPELPDSSTISKTEVVVGMEVKFNNWWYPCKIEWEGNDLILFTMAETGRECAGKKSLYEFRPIQPEQTERDKFALAAVKASERYSFGENLTAEDARQLYDWLIDSGMLTKKDDGND